MRGFCFRIIEDFASALDLSDLTVRPWYLITGKGGPNAVLKIVLPPRRGVPGYVLTVARHADTPVIAREADTLIRLGNTVSGDLRRSLPEILRRTRLDGIEYFGIPFYQSHGHSRLARRLTRRRRWRWVAGWLTDLARSTGTGPLDAGLLEREYGPTIVRVQDDSRICVETKRALEKHFQMASRNAGRIPGVCCHGDIWTENLLWKRKSRGAIILDWGAARWPGLPAVDLCRFALANGWPASLVTHYIKAYCDSIGLDPALVPALYDLYNLFIKAELDEAYHAQPHERFEPFLHGLPSVRLSESVSAFR